MAQTGHAHSSCVVSTWIDSQSAYEHGIEILFITERHARRCPVECARPDKYLYEEEYDANGTNMDVMRINVNNDMDNGVTDMAKCN